ncbi:MAG: PolC-type DNA polymerase III, partial [Bacilli bacterium]|nr:PolC-type DNA polymerase III [Bacilli bacterium]
MEHDLEKLLSEIHFNKDYHHYFNSVIISNVDYITTKEMLVINIVLDKALPLDIYLELEKCLHNFVYNIKFIYQIKQNVYLDGIIYDYYNYFYYKYHETKNKHFNLKYQDEELKVTYLNHSLKMSSQIYEKKLEHRMHLCGFNLDYNYDVDKDLVLENKVEVLMSETSKEIIFNSNLSNNNSNNSNNYQNNKRVRFNNSKNDLSKYEIVPISKLYQEYEEVCIEGYVFDIELRIYTNKDNQKRHIQTIYITDFEDSITMVRFENKVLTLEKLNTVEKGMWIKALGKVEYDNKYANEHVMQLKALEVIDSSIFEMSDDSPEKRVEFQIHTKMSTMDGVSDVSEFIKQALKYQHPALAITDSNNVQAYPEAYHALANSDLKLIYGLSSNIIDDTISLVNDDDNRKIDDALYICFDLETTGLNSKNNEIIEFGAIKYQKGVELARFQAFVKPEQPVPLFIKELTGITSNDLVSAQAIDVVLKEFINFIEDGVLVAHNASFDMSFIKENISKLNLDMLNNTVIDTVQLSRLLNKDRKFHNLGAVARSYNIGYDTEVAHRADYDADILGNIFLAMMDQLINEYHCLYLNDINKLLDKEFYMKQIPNNCSIIVKNQKGLKDLFKLVSIAHTELYFQEPLLFKSTINSYKQDLLIGSGNIHSEIYQNARLLVKNDFLKLLSFYDYIEILPPSDLAYLVDIKEYQSIEEIQDITKYIINCAKQLNKLVIAVGDVHYNNKMQKQYWEVYILALGKGKKRHYLNDRKRRIKNLPNAYYKNTKDMLLEFSFLGADLAKEIVITNTNYLANQIEKVIPIKDRLYTPKIDGVDDKLINLCYQNAYQQYGNPLPSIVNKRIEKELNSITKHGFSVVYYISSLLVEKSLNDGYIVGSRGSVGSSLVATMTNITEVNPLAPHYYCPQCQYSEFIDDVKYSSGYDLPDKECPHCHHNLIGDGNNIPFETFLGFEGDKVPDIDLNFSGDYQSKAHNFTKELFGENNVFRAGTISTIQNKTAYGYALGYYENKSINHGVRSAEYLRLAKGCEGTKSTTGQHPGGIIIIPDDMDVYDFTPINYPADDIKSEWMTTHFDFHAIHDNVLKMDILGHVDPTAIRMLQDLTNIKPQAIPTNDAKVLSLFNSNEALNLSEEVNYGNAAIGLPEFGTNFVRSMLEETKPQSFAELVQISGLSHGTDVWLNNAQLLIKNGTCQLNEVIGCRDDIMTYLINKGIDPKTSFVIMESVRKGKGLNPEWMKIMKDNHVPDWYIDSCLKIKYMFPKAHAVAYVLMAIRVAWFKLYYPLEYYATFFTTRCDYYEIETLLKGLEATKERLNYISAQGDNSTKKEKDLMITFEVAIEMFLRGFTFDIIDLLHSERVKFKVNHDNNSLILPFTSIDGLGDNIAKTVIEARQLGPFISIEDLENKTSLNKNHIDILKNIGSLADL